jgi:hypothetical protein
MPLTTGGPPPPGIYWQAAIFTAMDVVVEPNIVMRNIPDLTVDLTVTPRIQMLPPQLFPLLISPMIVMKAGTEETTSFNLRLSPNIHWIPTTAVQLTFTPSIGMAAKGITRGRHINTAVTRAATY